MRLILLMLLVLLAGCASPQKHASQAEVDRLNAQVDRLLQDRAAAEARARHAWFLVGECSQGRCPEDEP
jgi:outer membrane murein-binding lipoprotein Lpp